MVNHLEARIQKKYEDKGYDVISTGVPDFICLKDGEILFVEVKSEYDALRPNQRETIRKLKKHKIKVKIERSGSKRMSNKDDLARPAFLSGRQWEYVLMLKKHNGVRFMAAQELGVTVNAIEKMLTLIRKKMESAYTFKRKYGKLIERQR